MTASSMNWIVPSVLLKISLTRYRWTPLRAGRLLHSRAAAHTNALDIRARGLMASSKFPTSYTAPGAWGKAGPRAYRQNPLLAQSESAQSVLPSPSLSSPSRHLLSTGSAGAGSQVGATSQA